MRQALFFIYFVVGLIIFDLEKAQGEALFVDHLKWGNKESEEGHQVRVGGRGEVEELKTVMGGLERRYAVRTLEGTDSMLNFQMKKGERGGDFILEIQEIHNRRPQAYGYSIFVNGKELYFRTYQELGGGPNHYFVLVPEKVAEMGKNLEVTFKSAGSFPFSLAQVWLYNDFFKSVDATESVYRPMGLNGKFEKPSASEKPMSCFFPLGDMHLTNYQNNPTEKTNTGILKSIDKASKAGSSVEVVVNGATWGGAPNGPDGLGGYFCDSRYSQVSYDSERKAYRPSWPNMWGSSIWSTFRDPYMNEQMKNRFFESMLGVPEKIAFDQARGLNSNLIFVREMGPPLGEVTAATMASARKEGINLDRADGLSEEEKEWVFQDGVRLWQEYANDSVKAIGRNSVIVDQGEVRLPTDQVIENLYAQTYFPTDGPRKDPRWFGGQTGMVKGFWSSGEISWHMFTYYDYLRANGKLAHVNLEATILKEDYTPLRNLYATGFQYVTLFNDLQSDTPLIRKVDGFESMPMFAPEHHEPYFFEAPYRLLSSLGSLDQIVSQENIQVHSRVLENADSQACPRLSVTDCSKPGEVVYRIENRGEAFESDLTMELDGRISPGKGNSIEVWVGESLTNFKRVAVVTEKQLPCPDHWEPFMTSKSKVGLGKSVLGKKSCYLKLVMHAEGARDAAFLLSCRVGSQWSKKSGHLNGMPWTMKENRTLELWVQDRAVADRLIEQYRELGGEPEIVDRARELFESGRYRTVQTLLNGELSQILPARYAVRGNGKLGRYPVEVKLANESDLMLVSVLSMSKQGVEIKLTPEQEKQRCEISVKVGGGSKEVVLCDKGKNRYWIQIERESKGWMDRVKGLFSKSAQDATVEVVDGVVQLKLEVLKEIRSKPILPREIVGRFLGGDRKSIRFDTQELALMNFEESMSLPVSEGVIVSRKPAGMEIVGESVDWPKRYDQVTVRLDEKGEVISIDALYGHQKGIIKAVYPVSVLPPYSNGEIEFENGSRYEFDVNAMMDTVAMHGCYRNYESKMLMEAFKPGQSIEVDYSPYMAKGGRPRITRVHQSWISLLDQNYVEMVEGEWKKAAYFIDKVVVNPHKPEPNYLHKIVMNLLRPSEAFTPGFIIYEVKSVQPLKSTVVEFTARAFEDSSSVEFWVSDDNKNWVQSGRFDNTWQNSYPQSIDSKVMKLPWQFVDLTSAVQGKNSFYLKVVLRVNSADERFCVGAIRVVTEK